jgi:hypothetical protein
MCRSNSPLTAGWNAHRIADLGEAKRLRFIELPRDVPRVRLDEVADLQVDDARDAFALQVGETRRLGMAAAIEPGSDDDEVGERRVRGCSRVRGLRGGAAVLSIRRATDESGEQERAQRASSVRDGHARRKAHNGPTRRHAIRADFCRSSTSPGSWRRRAGSISTPNRSMKCLCLRVKFGRQRVAAGDRARARC